MLEMGARFEQQLREEAEDPDAEYNLGLTRFYARHFPEAALHMQRRMFKRRNVEQTPEDEALMRAVYEATRDERGMAAEPLSL